MTAVDSFFLYWDTYAHVKELFTKLKKCDVSISEIFNKTDAEIKYIFHIQKRHESNNK
jgi:hypothetical protein